MSEGYEVPLSYRGDRPIALVRLNSGEKMLVTEKQYEKIQYHYRTRARQTAMNWWGGEVERTVPRIRYLIFLYYWRV